MSSWSGKSKGNVLGYKIFVWTMKYAGLGPAYFVLRLVSLYFFLFSWKTSALLFDYFRNKLHLGWLPSVSNIYTNYYLFGQTLIDRVCMMAGFKNKLTFTSEGHENLQQMAEDKTGGILISAHVGNYELAGHALSIKTKINIVLFEGEHAKIKQYITGVQKENSFNVIVVNDHSFDHIYKINEAIGRNELICIHGDRFVPGTKTVTCPFLGQEARFPMGPFALAAQLQVPVSFVYAVKQSKYHYHFSASKPVTCIYQVNRKLREAETLKILNDYVASLEQIVKRFPHQWYNYYDFWSTH